MPLAEVLGIDEPGLHLAVREAARKAGHQDGGITISWARDITTIPVGTIRYEHIPDKDSVAIIYGATEKVSHAIAAAATAD